MKTRQHTKLFIPGPIEVSKQTRLAMTKPTIGHRGKDFQELFADVQSGLKKLFYTDKPVFLSTSSAWGVMEGAVRNLTSKKTLNCCCGGFSTKWHDVTKRCGKQADALVVDQGQHIDPAILDEKLSSGAYDMVTLVHNESTTGVINPLKEISEVVKKYDDVIFVVDTVSSFSTIPIKYEELGIDLILTGVQKALALPPGLSLFCVSDKALEKAKTINDRGYYFDILEFKKFAEKNMTLSTPAIPQIFALQHKLNEILEEGLENRYKRHKKIKSLVLDWIKEHNFELFPEEHYSSPSLSCIKNTQNIDVPKWINIMKDNFSFIINGGYGDLKGKTFRISHMGDETQEDIKEMLHGLTESLKILKK